MLGHPEWRDDPRFRTNTARMANLRRAGRADERRARARARTAEWIDALRRRGRARRARCTRSARRSTHPQTLARGMVVDARRIPRPARRRRSAARSTSRRRRRAVDARRAAARASTRARCCASTATRDAEIDALVAEGVVRRLTDRSVPPSHGGNIAASILRAMAQRAAPEAGDDGADRGADPRGRCSQACAEHGRMRRLLPRRRRAHRSRRRGPQLVAAHHAVRRQPRRVPSSACARSHRSCSACATP